jgi:hypothetical protein
MIDNGSLISTNTNNSIRTNYNNYKRKIKRVNSKPNISRTKEFFNNEIIRDNKNNHNGKGINYYYTNQTQKDKYQIKQNHSLHYPTEEISDLSYQQNSDIPKKALFPNTKRVIDTNYQEAPKIQKHINNDNTPKDDWSEMLCHPSNNSLYSKNKRISNSKTFQSNVFPNANEPVEKIRHSRETKFSDRLHKTQITTLPGCIKRGKYDIKDDKNFNVRNTESYFYKMEHDFSSNVHFGPLTKEEEMENKFPIEQRYQGSYQRGVRDNDIFNLKMNGVNKYDYGNEYVNDEEEKSNYKGKKKFINNNTFKSQIEFV